MRKNYIKSLNGLRVIATLAIFIHHYVHYILPSINYDLVNYAFGFITLFFLLSGFVMMYNYKNKIENNLFNYKTYIVKKLVKFYPLYIFTLVLSIVVKPLPELGLEFFKILFANLFLIQAFIPIVTYNYTFNFVSWFISALLFCYLLFPFVAKFLIHLNFKSIKMALILISLIFLVDLVITGRVNPAQDLNMVIYHSPITHFVEFLIGMLVFLIYDQRKYIYSLNKFTWTILELVALRSVFLYAYFIPLIKEQYKWSILFLPSMVLLLVIFSLERGYASKFFSLSIFQRFSAISYEFYMIHGLVILYFLKLIEGITLTPLALFTIIFLLTLTLSIILHYLILNIQKSLLYFHLKGAMD